MWDRQANELYAVVLINAHDLLQSAAPVDRKFSVIAKVAELDPVKRQVRTNYDGIAIHSCMTCFMRCGCVYSRVQHLSAGLQTV